MTRTAFSALAWEPADDAAAGRILKDEGVDGVELVPTKIWDDIATVPASEAARVRKQWEDLRLPVVALQALLFGRPDLQLFGSDEQVAALRAHLLGVAELGARLGARALVLGAPGNRRRGSLQREVAFERAAEVLRPVAEKAAEWGTCLCIEPNPEQYGADFVVNAAEGLSLVQAVDSAGFRLHLDTACMTLAQDDLAHSVVNAGAVLQHVHASEPDLAPVQPASSAVDHDRAAGALHRGGYRGFVSVEMRPAADDVLGGIRAAARQAVAVYGRSR